MFDLMGVICFIHVSGHRSLARSHSVPTWKLDGRTVDKVYTVGCFDLFHDGHRILLERLHNLGKQVSRSESKQNQGRRKHFDIGAANFKTVHVIKNILLYSILINFYRKTKQRIYHTFFA